MSNQITTKRARIDNGCYYTGGVGISAMHSTSHNADKRACPGSVCKSFCDTPNNFVSCCTKKYVVTKHNRNGISR